MNLDVKSFNFLSILTALVVLPYVFAATYSFSMSHMTWQEYSSVVGPVAGTLLGYWIRGAQ